MGKFISMAIQGETFGVIVVALMSLVILVFLFVLLRFLKDTGTDVMLDEILKDKHFLSNPPP